MISICLCVPMCLCVIHMDYFLFLCRNDETGVSVAADSGAGDSGVTSGGGVDSGGGSGVDEDSGEHEDGDLGMDEQTDEEGEDEEEELGGDEELSSDSDESDQGRTILIYYNTSFVFKKRNNPSPVTCLFTC